MEAEFWRKRWRDNQLGWHQPQAHPMLVAHVSAPGLREGDRVFVPLCGKTLDIHWLLANGFRVAGAELVETAVQQLFAELGLEPAVTEAGTLRRYSAGDADIFVGDFFDLDRARLGSVDAVYDRAALVALPAQVRPRYAAHVDAISGHARQLVVTFDYDQSLIEGPPFSVVGEEVERLYGASYEAALLESADLAGGLKGVAPAQESAWLLS